MHVELRQNIHRNATQASGVIKTPPPLRLPDAQLRYALAPRHGKSHFPVGDHGKLTTTNSVGTYGMHSGVPASTLQRTPEHF